MTKYQTFKLTKTLANIPAGATGRLLQVDDYHVALIWDNSTYGDLVFDVMDTEPEVWSAIQKTKPPKPYRLTWIAVITLAFALGWVAGRYPTGSVDRNHYVEQLVSSTE